MTLRKKFYSISFVLLMGSLSSCLSRPQRFSSTYPINKSTSHMDVLTHYAQLIGVDSHDLQNPALYSFIDEWMGAPHRLGGETKKGIDCSAFVNYLFREVYQKQIARSSYEMADNIKRKYENQLNEGDLVFFSFGRKSIDHVGLYLKNSKFVHVSTSQGVIISDLHDPWFYKYFVRAGSIK